MTVKPRGQSFQATVHHKGERFRRDFETEREALIWEAETKAKLLKGERPELGEQAKPEAQKKSDSIEAVKDKAERLHWARLKGSYKAVQNAEVFVQWAGPRVSPAKALTQDMVDKFVEHLITDRKVSNSTINRYMSAVSVLLKFAGLEKKPELPFYKPGKGRVRFFTEAEEQLLMQTWRQWGELRACDLLTVLIDTGARPWAEACKAPWRDIATNERKITFWDTKNGDPRTLPLTTRALQAIQRQPREHDGPFTDVDPQAMNRLWDRTQATHPQFADAVLYTARHTCASRLVQRGIDLRRVKDWMGHRSFTTTLIYAHLAPDNLMDAVNVLESDYSNVTALKRHTPHGVS